MDIGQIRQGWWLEQMNKRYYRKYIEKLITANPTNIIILRYIEKDDGFGGKIKDKIVLESQEVNIYERKSQREIVTDAGEITYSAVNIEKLLARYDADIKEGDVFEANNRRYRIKFIKNYLDICKQAELEVIEWQ